MRQPSYPDLLKALTDLVQAGDRMVEYSALAYNAGDPMDQFLAALNRARAYSEGAAE